jgi:hypothetical protein
MTTFLGVRNWKKFQHYKDRQPPWIKLYTALLDDPKFLALPDAAKGQLCALFLLAAKRGNLLPDKPSTLRVLIGCTGRLYLPELLAGGWIEHASSDASALASTGASAVADSDASPLRARSREGEGEAETKPEKEKTPTNAREVFFAAVPEKKRIGWLATLSTWTQGMGTPSGKPYTAEQIDAGLAEYMASAPNPDFSASHVVRFVEKVATRKPLPPGRTRDTGSFLDLVDKEGAA